MSIKAEVEKKLKEIEEKEQIKIIYCVESGSRAWDLASPDSDYDVRFIYVRKEEAPADTIVWETDKVWDIEGWDIRKILSLLKVSDPTVFEWNNSPIVYRKTEEWDMVREVIGNYFCPKKVLGYYLDMSKKNYENHIQGEEVDLKKYFYVLRGIFSCRWILDRKTPPPIPFSEVFDKNADDFVRKVVENLCDRKIKSEDMKEQKPIPVLNEYIERLFSEIEQGIAGAEEVKGDEKALDDLLAKILG